MSAYKVLVQVKIYFMPNLKFNVVDRTGGDRQLWCLNSDGSLESRCGAFAEVVEGDEGKLQVTKQKFKVISLTITVHRW